MPKYLEEHESWFGRQLQQVIDVCLWDTDMEILLARMCTLLLIYGWRGLVVFIVKVIVILVSVIKMLIFSLLQEPQLSISY